MSLARTMPSRCHRHSLIPPNPPSLPPSLPTLLPTPLPSFSLWRVALSSSPSSAHLGTGSRIQRCGRGEVGTEGQGWRRSRLLSASRRLGDPRAPGRVRARPGAERERACILKEPARSLDILPSLSTRTLPPHTHNITDAKIILPSGKSQIWRPS